MSSNKKPNDDIVNRVSEFLSKGKSTGVSDEELAQRFTNVFSTAPIATQSKPNYHIPNNAYSDDIDREIERMLQESDDEDDAIDAYLYDVLKSSVEKNTHQDKLKSVVETFTGPDSQYDTDESSALIKRLQQENALDAKYQQFVKTKDQDIEKRYLDLKKYTPTIDTVEKQDSNKPKGSIPKALSTDDFHDEIDDWCCICNDDATVECEGCEDDNKYCGECYFHTHRSESADYEATKHTSKPYKKYSSH